MTFAGGRTSYEYDDELVQGLDGLPRLDLRDIDAARRSMRSFTSGRVTDPDVDVSVRDVSVPGPGDRGEVRLRVYRPRAGTGAGILDVHPGGFVLGDLDADIRVGLSLARALGATVVSVDYRLAPENRYPAALEDCYAALTWFAANAPELGVDPGRIALHGTSAGAGLCAAVALLARDRGGPPIRFQYLGYPQLDDRLQTASMHNFVDTPLWDRASAERSWDCYLGPGVRGTDQVSPYAAPARATSLAGLPPAYVSAMMFDPLRDEAISYARALVESGVLVELHLFPGTFHGSSALTADVSRRENRERVAVLTRALVPTAESSSTTVEETS